jgi:hypothetical protein
LLLDQFLPRPRLIEDQTYSSAKKAASALPSLSGANAFSHISTQNLIPSASHANYTNPAREEAPESLAFSIFSVMSIFELKCIKARDALYGCYYCCAGSEGKVEPDPRRDVII